MAIRRACECFLFFLLIALTACIGPGPAEKPPLETEGEVVVYLEPLPQSARHLRFDFDFVTALGPGGASFPLSLYQKIVSGKDLLDRQKRLAAGPLPPGTYSGLTLQISSARLLGEQGEADLLLSGAPVTVAKPFEIIRGQATALFLRFDASGLLPGSVVFDPTFSLNTASRQLFNLYGYISNAGVNRLTVFNKKTMRITDVIATGRKPGGIAVARQRRRVYVACAGDDRIQEVDVLKGAVVGSIELQFGDGPRELAVTPDGRILVAANYESDTASIIDLSARAEIFRVNVGRRPLGVVIDERGALAFIVNSFSNSVSVVDIQQGAVVGQLPVETYPLRAVIEPDGNRLFVIHRQSPNIMVFETDRFTLLGKIFAGPGSTAITRDPSNRLVYVGTLSGDIQIVSPQSLMFIDTIRTGAKPLVYLAFEEEETSLYAIRSGGHTLLKIDLTSKRILSEMEVETEAYAVAVIGER